MHLDLIPPSRAALAALLGLGVAAGCASAPAPPPAPPPPVHFVDDPVDLLPELQGVVHVNVRRLRSEKEIFERLLERALASADDEEERAQLRFLAEHTDTILFGIGRRVQDDPDFVMVVRTSGEKLLRADGTALGTQTTQGLLGFHRAKLDEDDLVLVDDFTAILYEPGLRTSVEAILSKRPGKRFRDEPAFQGLAKEVAFGSAPVSLLGTLPPEVVAKLSGEAPPALMPLVQALGAVHSYGGQIDISTMLDLRLFAQGRGSSPVGLLAGAILMMKNALAQSNDDPRVAQLARDLRVEARGDVLELSYSLSKEQLLEMLDKWIEKAGQDAEPAKEPPPGSSEI